MGGHGVYVWSVFLLCVLLLIIEGVSLLQLKQKTLKRFRRIRLLASKKGDK
ncbi:MAG: heme exporter protein CcmD [Alcaligenaceae bacterium]|nr:heme exporter protein CcmD [Alcaligenaceae bacterium]